MTADGTAVPTPAQRMRELADGTLQALRDARPLFHKEADFQHAFAWELHSRHPDAQIRLERRLSVGSNERVDVIVRLDARTYAVELKYKTARFDAEVGGERFLLSDQAAEDESNFLYVWDIVRLERLVALGEISAGAAVMITNQPTFWAGKRRRAGTTPADLYFRLVEGRELAERIAWAGGAWWRGKYPEHVDLVGRYPVAWQPYSAVEGAGRGEFRSLTSIVAAAG